MSKNTYTKPVIAFYRVTLADGYTVTVGSPDRGGAYRAALAAWRNTTDQDGAVRPAGASILSAAIVEVKAPVAVAL